MMLHTHTGYSNAQMLLAMGLVLFSVFAFTFRDKLNSGRLDLLKAPSILNLLKKRPFQFLFQLPFILVFFLIIAAGLYGTQRPGANFSTVVTWTVWWVGLIAATLFIGKLWCCVCPWGAVGDFVQRLGFWKRKKTGFSLEKKWPVGLRNLYPSIFLFMLITWAEFEFSLVSSPRGTANLAIIALFAAVFTAIIFERRSFCRYLCPVGAMIGLYSMSSSLELRCRDRSICRGCPTKDCVNGNDLGYGCPVFEYPESMEVNTYCILCTECLKTCPKENIAVGLRPLSAELLAPIRKRLDEGLFAVVILGVVIFHSFTMIDLWFEWLDISTIRTGLSQKGVAALSLLATILAVGLLYASSCLATRIFLPRGKASLKEVFTSFAYPLIPVALFYHLAHNSMHLLTEGGVSSVVLDPFGASADISARTGGVLVSHAYVEYLQLAFVLMGIWYGLRISARLSDSFGNLAAYMPQVLMIGFLTVLYGWILTQPMLMRMG